MRTKALFINSNLIDNFQLISTACLEEFQDIFDSTSYQLHLCEYKNEAHLCFLPMLTIAKHPTLTGAQENIHFIWGGLCKTILLQVMLCEADLSIHQYSY